MKVLKREIIYTCEIEYINGKGKKVIDKIECNNKGILKSSSKAFLYDEWKILEKEVKRQFKNKTY